MELLRYCHFINLFVIHHVQAFKDKIDPIARSTSEENINLADRLPQHLVDSLMDFQRQGVM